MEDCNAGNIPATYSLVVCHDPKLTAVQCLLKPKRSGVFPSLNKLPNSSGGSGDVSTSSSSDSSTYECHGAFSSR